MTTAVTFRQEGFAVTGLKPGLKGALSALQEQIGAHSIAWGDLRHTSLLVTCDWPEGVWMRLRPILDDQGLTTWKQIVTFLPLDEQLTAICFETELPQGDLGRYALYTGVSDIFSSERTLMLRRTPNASDDDWRRAQQNIWQRLSSAGIPRNAADQPPQQPLPRMKQAGQIIVLDDSLVAIRSLAVIREAADAFNSRDLCQALKGNHTLLLMAKRMNDDPLSPLAAHDPMQFSLAIAQGISSMTVEGYIGKQVQLVRITL